MQTPDEDAAGYRAPPASVYLPAEYRIEPGGFGLAGAASAVRQAQGPGLVEWARPTISRNGVCEIDAVQSAEPTDRVPAVGTASVAVVFPLSAAIL